MKKVKTKKHTICKCCKRKLTEVRYWDTRGIYAFCNNCLE